MLNSLHVDSPGDQRLVSYWRRWKRAPSGGTAGEAELGVEQRNVSCNFMQGDKVTHALKSLELPQNFWQSTFKSQVREVECGPYSQSCGFFSSHVWM